MRMRWPRRWAGLPRGHQRVASSVWVIVASEMPGIFISLLCRCLSSVSDRRDYRDKEALS